ncbi:alkaline phosphatase [Spongiibacter sp. KMU-158]|uniref:Alkaline phosphatase n=1 Tax=Spongiibacter pelagi TaxID=2760804 RepID=A0A927C2E8_9GAMM|nr:alkaline phosphatase [Spongiibacter pelagi]MBD2858923.1 alkaline phosphatase [Spongiibacter pelagi]
MPPIFPLKRLASAAAITLLCGCSAFQTSTPETGKAKNVILFIGDGMGISTVTAMRIYAGQQAGGSGEEYVLPFETFDHVALVKTYNTNQQVPDSAGTASAMHTGHKTRAGVLGIGPEARRQNCAEAQQYPLATLGEQAKNRGLSVGIVSTARLTHATPGAVYAHTLERDWENDQAMPELAHQQGCVDIAKQLLSFPFDLALGGGLANFLPTSEGGKRGDNNIVTEWQQRTQGSFAKTAAQMYSAPTNAPLLGLFSPSHMSYMLDKTAESTEPTLAEMTTESIRRLASKNKGYYLMVESGRIDHGHHAGQAGYALTEGAAFADAIQAAMDVTNPEETLILVTADHSHVLTMAGYPTRGNPILGLVVSNDSHGETENHPALAGDGVAYTTLGYQNGPGAVSGKRPTPDTGEKALQQSLIPAGSETHAGEDVALYAHGPGAERVKGVMEQNRIYDVISRALGLKE